MRVRTAKPASQKRPLARTVYDRNYGARGALRNHTNHPGIETLCLQGAQVKATPHICPNRASKGHIDFQPPQGNSHVCRRTACLQGRALRKGALPYAWEAVTADQNVHIAIADD
jgi:hypothetical protein